MFRRASGSSRWGRRQQCTSRQRVGALGFPEMADMRESSGNLMPRARRGGFVLTKRRTPWSENEQLHSIPFPRMTLSDLRVFVFAERAAAADGAGGSSAAAGSVLARSAAPSAQARVRRVLPLISYSQKWREMRKCAVFVTMTLGRAQQAAERNSPANRVYQS